MNEINIPHKVNIKGIEYEVEYEKGLMDRGSMFGQINYVSEKIFIDKDLSDRRKLQTFLHEMTHGILFESGDRTKDHDEEWIDKFSNTLMQVILDNGWQLVPETPIQSKVITSVRIVTMPENETRDEYDE